ncbi:MAG: 50S ribosomal protein L17 [Flavobacteriales bacterium]|nr:50S ribosomal protein L17 [Flavobacteriales bacterium]
MRHKKSFNHLSRKAPHRKAMLANMACSLIEHKRITTTVAKAKALRMFVEPLITKSKNDSTHSRRVVFSYLRDKNAVSELFRDVAVKVSDRPGGYTRILKTGNRLGDNADMCLIELVDYNENMLKDSSASKTKKRTRRGKKKEEEGAGYLEGSADASAIEDAKIIVEDKAPEAVAETTEKVTPAVEVSTEEVVVDEAPAEETPKEESAEDSNPSEEDSTDESEAK